LVLVARTQRCRVLAMLVLRDEESVDVAAPMVRRIEARWEEGGCASASYNIGC
jgi:hypothetical protein